MKPIISFVAILMRSTTSPNAPVPRYQTILSYDEYRRSMIPDSSITDWHIHLTTAFYTSLPA